MFSMRQKKREPIQTTSRLYKKVLDACVDNKITIESFCKILDEDMAFIKKEIGLLKERDETV